MENLTSLFLSQSYKDTLDDYSRSLNNTNFPLWDYVILTASNEKQADGYRLQLEERKNLGLLPQKTHFAVVPDPDGERVGSGGATLAVLKYIVNDIKSDDFSGLRILVIHSGGDSKRVPQYSALGKLFSPVLHTLPSGRSSTLFDEFMISMSSVPSRIKEGMLLLSGDVLLLFNPLLIDYQGKNAAAITFKENVETGKNHGVFLRGEDGNVSRFLHKQSVETLRKAGAVNERDCVDIDTGAVIFSNEILKSLFSLIGANGKVDTDKFNSVVNCKVRLSLYGDFLFPLATDSTEEDYLNSDAEGERCDELLNTRKVIWKLLHPYNLKMFRLAPAKFIHFGTTREIMKLATEDIGQYRHLDWNNCINSSISGDVAGYNSVVSENANVGKNCFFEVSYVHSKATVGDNVLLSYITVNDETIPSNVVMHGLKQNDGSFVVRIFGVNDNSKLTLESGCPFLETTLDEFMNKNGISADELWDDDNHSLWKARLYPVCDTVSDGVQAALNVYNMAHGCGDVNVWRNSIRKNLASGFMDADSSAIIAWDKRMSEIVEINKIYRMIVNGEPINNVKQLLNKPLTKLQLSYFNKLLSDVDFSQKMRLYYYVGTALGGISGDKYISECFKCIGDEILSGSLNCIRQNENRKIVCDKHTVKLPLRVNWGGGWSDTPPYCNELGGTVLNAAILLNGEMPVEVTLERIDDSKIIFISNDMGTYGEFSDISELQKTGDPYDQFALQKAALFACGIIPFSGGNLSDILKKLGGGFKMYSNVTGVPKGSGLGTSSILAAACVKALLEFFGENFTDSQLFDSVLCMEQIMSTGGGWQDQVGGVLNGIKYITSKPGLHQNLEVSKINMPDSAFNELNDRFALIYTGQRRLARNLLRDVIGRYIGNNEDALFALNEIQRIAALMRFELERGNISEFAALLSKHWELSKVIDMGSTNNLINQIFDTVNDLIDGKMICGAGGGGFLQIVMKRGVTSKDLRNRLKSVFQDSDIDVWDCTIV